MTDPELLDIIRCTTGPIESKILSVIAPCYPWTKHELVRYGILVQKQVMTIKYKVKFGQVKFGPSSDLDRVELDQAVKSAIAASIQ